MTVKLRRWRSQRTRKTREAKTNKQTKNPQPKPKIKQNSKQTNKLTMKDFELWEVILVNPSKQERLMMEKY